jgi:hypothetical protein
MFVRWRAGKGELKKGVQWVKELTAEDLQMLEELPLSLYIPAYGRSGGAGTWYQ